MQAQVRTTSKGVSEEAEGRKLRRHPAAGGESERDTAELCPACPSTLWASANIHAFPSAIVLPKQEPKDHSLEKEKKKNDKEKKAAASLLPPPSPLPPLSSSDSLRAEEASGQHL